MILLNYRLHKSMQKFLFYNISKICLKLLGELVFKRSFTKLYQRLYLRCKEMTQNGKKITPKFVSCMKNVPITTTNDNIGRALVCSIVLPKTANRLHVILFIQNRGVLVIISSLNYESSVDEIQVVIACAAVRCLWLELQRVYCRQILIRFELCECLVNKTFNKRWSYLPFSDWQFRKKMALGDGFGQDTLRSLWNQ